MKKKLKIILVSLAVIIALALILFLVAKPALDKYVVKKQVEVQIFILQDMVYQLQNTGAYQITLGNETLVLVPYK